MVTAFIVLCELLVLVKKAMTCGKYLVLYTPQYTVLYMSQRSVYVDVWFVDLALTMKELLFVMPLIGACFFACGLACKVG